ncbi:hypothetical protein TREMEDRAFT_63482 [Tremella mesenterica DSM 1558]|uniref:uncharacterized protein n=1 Tax=Tremella mesenterica (strain ATCC 24925 / CBS 8224 / DSM 1558 / NBRC 9311 / NRRL Y-6157 / RJB 2259-6 / UBC 559-6) TaxID=578456 RepID=UPI0003F49860|nr:uncharacterized protein TREMEDRAFT_63482 [Tremella mesenterica DSM 1558]EIW68309.1 hypothetical protein TREMEDRAFT_63482 [Tremella mesenterica DSM 1558]
MFKLATFFYSLMLAGAASAISLPVKGRGEGMTNADRLKRGLPLRSLTSPYNASRVNAAPAKRSDANQIAYLQAVPPEARKRSPYTQTSYLFYDRDAGIFRLTTDQTQASPFIVPEYGVEEYLYYQRDDTVYPLCSSTWSGGEANNMETDNPGGSTAIVFTLCGSTRPVDQSYGTNTQTPIWTIPPRDFWPAPAGQAEMCLGHGQTIWYLQKFTAPWASLGSHRHRLTACQDVKARETKHPTWIGLNYSWNNSKHSLDRS